MFGLMDGVFAHGGQVASLADHRLEIAGSVDGFGIAVIVLSLILWVTVMTALVLSIMELLRRRKAPKPSPDLAGQGPAGPDSAPARPAPLSSGPEVLSEALRILDERYARGEMTPEEYLRRKADLTGSQAFQGSPES